MKTYIVYKHQSRITGKVYIGITCQNPIKRWGAGNNYRGCLHFYAAILKYGWDSFDHIILYDSLSKDEAITIEKTLIVHYKSLGISYNITEGGEGVIKDCRVSEETRIKMSEAQKGRKHSEDTKRRISENRKGIKYSEETIRKMSSSHKGKHLSETAKSKISKPVIQFDLNGNIIAIWKSISEACRTLGFKSHSKISECCYNRRVLRGKIINKPTAYGYKWKFEDNLDL